MATVFGTDKDLYTDAKITLSVTPDADLSSVTAIRAYLVRDGQKVQWGSDQPGVSTSPAYQPIRR